jgi:hypothetical protein
MPIWVGCFWETPATLGKMALLAGTTPTPSVTLETATSGIGISDLPNLPPTAGNVSLYANEGTTSISLDASGVTITAPAVRLVTSSFTVNGAQFSVT